GAVPHQGHKRVIICNSLYKPRIVRSCKQNRLPSSASASISNKLLAKMDNSSEKQKQTQQEEQIAEVVSEELTALVEEIEVHLQRYLRRSVEEYPPGSQADWVATSVVERVMTSGSEADFKSMAKLCVFLVESLGDISTTYEEFYSEQLDTLKEQ
uniref:MIF4G domain-containing protein n=1 Tax=Macrostomum lignano TaxID=282301 RepID=A0A1I8GQI6_9PLAT